MALSLLPSSFLPPALPARGWAAPSPLRPPARPPARGVAPQVLALGGGRFGKKSAPPFRCLQCNKGCNNAKKCASCGNTDINRFAYAQRCSVCRGGRVIECYKCGGLGEIVKYKGWINREEVGSTECKVCSGERALPCGTCKGLGLVYYRSSDWR